MSLSRFLKILNSTNIYKLEVLKIHEILFRVPPKWDGGTEGWQFAYTALKF